MQNGSADTVHPGFRLARFEVLNWGTFDARVWKLEPDGENALLTGDIGSGKSTLVDALTTLLVPPRKITYNKAAGAETRERSLYSYVRGEYRSVTNELTGGAQAQALRGEASYSVLLAVFADKLLNRSVSLAQVFWLKEGERNPARFYVAAEGALSIAEHFANFGTDIQSLRKRLRQERRAALFDSFEEYGARLRRELGIPHAQALDLFYQTVSMKSVGNLTEFVRRHMLEPDDTGERIAALIGNFENLNRAHDAVVRARDQIERLAPVVEDGDRLQALEDEAASLRLARDALSPWFAGHRALLLGRRIEELRFETSKLDQRLSQAQARLAEISLRRADVRASIETQGGGRLRDIEADVERKRAEVTRQRADDDDYRKLCAALGLRPGTTPDGFVATTRAAAERRAQTEGVKRDLDLGAVDKAVEFKELDQRYRAVSEEVQSLKSRQSNIPAEHVRLRAALAEAVNAEQGDLPFVGELLKVRPDEARWEGAIERVLHGFGLSLLVPERLYAVVNHYVDRTHLRARLVYLRVREEAIRGQARSVSPHSVARKVAIKPDSGFYTFLERELAEQFDYACCDSLEELKRLPRAITDNGLIKGSERRHEKDDRHRLDDRSRYVLGWDNREKLKALEGEQREVRRRLLEISAERDRIRKQVEACELELRAADQLLMLKEFGRIDWRATTLAIQKLDDERLALESSNDTLRTLREQLAHLDTDYAALEAEQARIHHELGALASRIERDEQERTNALQEEAQLPEADKPTLSALLDRWRSEVLGEHAFELRALDAQQRRMREAIQARIDADDRSASRLRESIVDRMRDYKTRYPAESSEMDARTEALPEYRRRLAVLREDDLPRFEARFKELLTKETINGMAAFQAHLQKRRGQIEEKIHTINASLAAIEYDRGQGTFIELVSLASPDPEVRDFQASLRACLSGGDDSGELYTEQKFLQVKALVERLAGREGQADLDARWSTKVTDVRSWFEFGAAERWRADGSEREFYRDSSGKSGGQKEKLAYTILAAALAYQFGLDDTDSRKRRFRFVAIDEAFGRGSDESTRYGLELFATLGLQLLIVTPLQKIAVIEDYIAAVHFVHNAGGASSMVQNLTIEEYRARKEEFRLRAAALA